MTVGFALSLESGGQLVSGRPALEEYNQTPYLRVGLLFLTHLAHELRSVEEAEGLASPLLFGGLGLPRFRGVVRGQRPKLLHCVKIVLGGYD